MEGAQTGRDGGTKSIDTLRLEYAQLGEKVSAYETQIQNLQAQLDWFKQQSFGQTSEKRSIENPDQRSLFEGLDTASNPTRSEEKISITYQRGKARKDRGGAMR